MRKATAAVGLLILLNGCHPLFIASEKNRSGSSLFERRTDLSKRESWHAFNSQDSRLSRGERKNRLGGGPPPAPLWFYEKRF